MPYGRRYRGGRRGYSLGRRRRFGWKLRLIPIGLFALYGLYYYISHLERVPMTDRRQLVDMTRDQEMQLGLQSYQQIMADSDVVDGDDPPQAREQAELIAEIGRRIAEAARAYDHDPGFDWRFNLINDAQANAFALPGGYTAMYTGILPMAKNVDGIAVIMGHEIAHATARHGAERMAHQKLVRFGSMALSLAVGDMGYQAQRAVMGALGAGAQYGVLLPFSRNHESEADYMGLLYMARACFDPREAPEVWKRMADGAKKSPAEFQSTHPSNETRISNFDLWMDEAMRVRGEYCEE